MKKTVVYISSCALNAQGKPGPFFLQELPWLRKHFDRVVLCSSSGVAEITQDRPERIAVTRPVHGALRAYLQAPFHRLFREELHHLRAESRLNVQTALKLLIFTVRGLKMHHWIQAVLHDDERTTLYAYWLSFDGFAAALCKRKNPGVRAIARAHAFDIDVQRNPMNPYLMKRFMARTLDLIYPISLYAREQLLSYLEMDPANLPVIGVGSTEALGGGRLPAPRFADGVFHLVSCSAMIEVKQLPLLIDTLAMWETWESSLDAYRRWTGRGKGSRVCGSKAAKQRAGRVRISRRCAARTAARPVRGDAFRRVYQHQPQRRNPRRHHGSAARGHPGSRPAHRRNPRTDRRARGLFVPGGRRHGRRARRTSSNRGANARGSGVYARGRTGALDGTLRSPTTFAAAVPRRDGGNRIRMSKRILLISHCFAPQNKIGAVRADEACEIPASAWGTR